MEFTKRYEALNANQRQAVDTIYGPLMVVAGPGTGKTELLSVRAANILRQTDANPGNILCLTFTDSGATAMRERLYGLIGPDAYKVAIHTFHSFGSEIISTFGNYFYHGAHFRPADDVTRHELLSELLDKLPHDNPLASTMNGQYTYIGDLQTVISEFKRSGLTPDELDTILDRNDTFIAWIKTRLDDVFSPRLSKKSFPAIANLLDEIDSYAEDDYELISYKPLRRLIWNSLHEAYSQSVNDNTTKPLSAWKKRYLSKDADNHPILRDENAARTLRPSVRLYYEYLMRMQELELYDYDDMILRVVHALEVFNELRYELQETYQFIMVDEFQDTNDAQMRLVWNLTNNESQHGKPNLMVVGDDDQAIYRFQGANMSNIIDFTTRYTDVKVVTLTDNYRSAAPILEIARGTILQGEERLETTLGIDKTLTPHYQPGAVDVSWQTYATELEARHALAERVRHDFAAEPSHSYAIIARNHRQLIALLPHLQAAGLPLRYERQENILDSEPVMQLELVGRIVAAIAAQDFDIANELLPELLSHPAWAVPPLEIWEMSLQAHRNRKFWLEEMISAPGRLHDIAEWLIVAAHLSQHETLERMCDYLFGAVDRQSADEHFADATEAADQQTEQFVSPYRAWFFPSESLETQPAQYLQWLSALRTLRSALREFRPNSTLQLADLIEFFDIHEEMGAGLTAYNSLEHDTASITLLTAHKAKGLEFDHVYITDAQESIWGSSAKGRGRLIAHPANLPLAPAGDNSDERLRLLYVALTRAKSALIIFSGRKNDSGKEQLPVGTMPVGLLDQQQHDSSSVTELTAAHQADWHEAAADVPIALKEQMLRPLLDKYRMSATHFINYLDVTRGGPQLFLLHNLLRFPQSMGPGAAYGSAIHKALHRAHAHLAATGKRRPVEDVLHDYEEALLQAQLSDQEFQKQLARGSDALTHFLNTRYDSFSASQLSEKDFGSELLMIGDVRASGIIDLIDIDRDEKTIYITDYKTGKAARTWRGRTEYERIKLHHYEQQLMYYRLLVEQSRQFAGYQVTGARIEFVEPDKGGKVILLDYTYDDEKLAEFSRLVAAVWGEIMAMKFDAQASPTDTLQDILQFEDILLSQ